MPGYHLPYFTAAAQGIYAQFGLQVEIRYPEPGPDNIRAVARGEYDLCLTSVAHFLRALSEDGGVDARFVYMVAVVHHMGVLFARDRPTPSGRSIQGFADLQSARLLGERASPFTREYLHLMRVLGHPEPPIVQVPYRRIMVALAAGEGDVTADHVDLLPDYRAAAPELTIDALAFHGAGIDVYGSGVVAGMAAIRRRPHVLRAVVAAIGEAIAHTRRNPAAGIRPFLECFPKADAERTLASWQASEPLLARGNEGARTDLAKWRRTIAYYAAAHGTPIIPPARVWAAV